MTALHSSSAAKIRGHNL